MRPSVLLFVSSLALTSAQADERPKQGEESSTIYYVMLSHSPDVVEWAGIRRTDGGDAKFDKMGVRCTLHGFETGKCTLSDEFGRRDFHDHRARRVSLCRWDRGLRWNFWRGRVALYSPQFARCGH